MGGGRRGWVERGGTHCELGAESVRGEVPNRWLFRFSLLFLLPLLQYFLVLSLKRSLRAQARTIHECMSHQRLTV